MLRYALKEWAVICRALASGEQTILLRKGGIAEKRGDFEIEHRRFWLYPTYVHQQATGVRAEAIPLLEQVQKAHPPTGNVCLDLVADIVEVYHVTELAPLLQLAPLHLWSEETVRARFAYKQPGLHVLAVRLAKLTTPLELRETDAYAGCRSWVELDQPLPDDGATPVLDESALTRVLTILDQILQPPALA